jgi:hypothetical protein
VVASFADAELNRLDCHAPCQQLKPGGAHNKLRLRVFANRHNNLPVQVWLSGERHAGRSIQTGERVNRRPVLLLILMMANSNRASMRHGAGIRHVTR